MFQLSVQEQQILQKIMANYPYRFYAYGSRVKGGARKFSDLDICYQEDIPLVIVGDLREELEESDLPFMVELVAWKHMSPTFQEMIKPDLTLISSPTKSAKN